MIIVTSEYILLNPKLNETNNIKINTIVEHNKNYGDNHCRKLQTKYNIKFFDKTKNTTKNITTNRGEKKTIIASQGRYEYINVNKVILLIEGGISENVLNTCMKCIFITLLWSKFFLKIANIREYIDRYRNKLMFSKISALNSKFNYLFKSI